MSAGRTVWQSDAVDGHEILVTEDPYANRTTAKLYVDGQEVKINSVSRLRDGGTTILETDVGTITFWRRLGTPRRTTYRAAS